MTMSPYSSTEDSKEESKAMNGHINTEDVSKKALPPKKVYTRRNSVLTDLMEVNHLQTVYNISVAIFNLLLLNSVIYYIATPKIFWRDITLLSWGASNVMVFVKIWVSLNALAFLVFFGFKTWIRVRNKIYTKLADFVFLNIYIAAIIFMFIGTSYFALQNIRPITNFAIMCEQVRIFMKIYSFVRECAPRVLQYIPTKDGKQENNLVPTAKHYLYFLFAPTLIYRDSYPRKPDINYKFVATQVFTFFACVFICYCGCMRFMVDVFEDAGISQFTLRQAALTFAGSMVIGSLMMFVMFYGVLHSWLNIFAELLHFGDRQFYQDWWNSTSFSQYYRRWNTVVHDWLHAYIYIESYRIGLNKSLSLLFVFLVSSLVHEYIIALSLGFFYPVLAVVYSTIGVLLIFVTKKRTAQSWNTFMWSMLFSGWGVVICLYTLEWQARRNCKGIDDPLLDFFIPRSWSSSCHFLDFS